MYMEFGSLVDVLITVDQVSRETQAVALKSVGLVLSSGSAE